jgi:hypothetical protein
MRLFFTVLFIFQCLCIIISFIKFTSYILYCITASLSKYFERPSLTAQLEPPDTVVFPSVAIESEYTSINSYDETDYDSDDDIDITTSEIPYDETDKENGNYYIGIAVLLREGIYLLNSSISRRSFFAFEYSRILEYTYSISILVNNPNTQIQIIRLNIHVDGTYEAHIKTHWLRLVQRRWKRVYAERARIIRARGNVRHQEYFRTHGKYMSGYRTLPTLRGMLSDIPCIQKVPT